MNKRSHFSRVFAPKERKSNFFALSLHKKSSAEGKGSITFMTSLAFLKDMIKSNKRKFKRKEKNSHHSSYTSPYCEISSLGTNDSQDNELVTPISSMSSMGTEIGTNNPTEEVYENGTHEEKASTSMKEFLFEEDKTAVIFHFDESNQWAIEIIENNIVNYPTSMNQARPFIL